MYIFVREKAQQSASQSVCVHVYAVHISTIRCDKLRWMYAVVVKIAFCYRNEHTANKTDEV